MHLKRRDVTAPLPMLGVTTPRVPRLTASVAL